MTELRVLLCLSGDWWRETKATCLAVFEGVLRTNADEVGPWTAAWRWYIGRMDRSVRVLWVTWPSISPFTFHSTSRRQVHPGVGRYVGFTPMSERTVCGFRAGRRGCAASLLCRHINVIKNSDFLLSILNLEYGPLRSSVHPLGLFSFPFLSHSPSPLPCHAAISHIYSWLLWHLLYMFTVDITFVVDIFSYSK